MHVGGIVGPDDGDGSRAGAMDSGTHTVLRAAGRTALGGRRRDFFFFGVDCVSSFVWALR